MLRDLRSVGYIAATLALAIGHLGCASAIDQRGAEWSVSSRGELTALSALTPVQRASVLAGQFVTVPMVLEQGEHRYTGGVSHLLVNASADTLFESLSQPDVLRRVLPKTKRATLVEGPLDRGAQGRSVELVQGNSWVEATYTVILKQQPPTGDGSYRVDFRLDRTRPHDIEDLWGSFALTPVEGGTAAGRCVVSAAAFVDLGSSLAVLFEGRIQDLMLSTPWYVQRYVDETHLVGMGAPE